MCISTAESLTFNQVVAGSNPATPTKIHIMSIYNKKLPIGKMVIVGEDVLINEFSKIEARQRELFLNTILNNLDGKCQYTFEFGHLRIIGVSKNCLSMIDSALKKYRDHNCIVPKINGGISFDMVEVKCRRFAKFLIDKKEEIFLALGEYECHNAFTDELNRSIDVLVNISANKEYFGQGIINGTASFLPLNQPLYSLVCFGVIPSFLSGKCYVKPPSRCQDIFKALADVLDLENNFSNIEVHYSFRDEFIEKIKNDVSAVIFTGNPANGHVVRKKFSSRILFIFNGAGHNPVIVSNMADINSATDSILRLCFLNQGQDCAAPNSILVHESIYDQLKSVIVEKVKSLVPFVGKCSERKNVIGPNTQNNYAVKIAKEFLRLKDACILGGEVNVVTNVIYPTIFEIPLSVKPALKEYFAPVIILQKFSNEKQLLDLYFTHPKYKENAMYVSIFGSISQDFITFLVKCGLHSNNSILFDTDLHIEEKGYHEYGGNGSSASCIYFMNEKKTGATLPQRDIFMYLIKDYCSNLPLATEN